MLSSIALIILFGLFSAMISEKLKLAHIIGMLLVGIFNRTEWIKFIRQNNIRNIRGFKRNSINNDIIKSWTIIRIKWLKKVGRPAILLCFLLALFEIIGLIIFGPLLLWLSIINSAILGSIMGDVSPAVIVPRMSKML